MDSMQVKVIIILINLLSRVCIAEICPNRCNCERATNTVMCPDRGYVKWNLSIDEGTINVDLSNNRINTCPGLSTYRNLEIVNLSNNSLTNVNQSCFHEFAVLRLLDLSYNLLRTLPNFTTGAEIQVLNLTANRIIELKPIATYGLSSLRELILDNNDLEMFAGGELLQKTDKLEVLSLRNNKIKRFCANFTSRLFISATNLRELYVSNNSLLDRNTFWLIGASNLQILDLKAAYCSKNYSLGQRDNGWEFPGNSKMLRYLDLSQNKLIALGKWPFSGCPNLERINLTNSSLTEFKLEQLQDMKRITHLYVDYNYISNISSSLFFDLVNLRVLSMAFNNLRSSTISPISLTFMESVEVLNFSNNDIEDLNFLKRAASIRNLTKLILDNNQISNIQFINKMSSLRELSLYNNSLQRMPNINRLYNLQRVNLALNNITVLDFNQFWTTSSPVTIDLSRNQVGSVSRGELNTWSDYQTSWNVILMGNPLECTCAETWFEQESKSKVYNNSLLRLYDNIRFSCPSSGGIFYNISYALENSECVFIHRDALVILGCMLLVLACCAILAIGMTLGKRLERRHRNNRSGGGERGHPDSEKKLMHEKESNERRTDNSPAFMIAEKDQHLKDAISLSNLKGSMVKLDNDNVKPFFREIYV